MSGSSPEPIDLDEARAHSARNTGDVDIDVDADVAPHLAALYRTENIAIAPDGRRALIPSFHADFLLLVDLELVHDGTRTSLQVTNPNVIQSTQLCYPHGAVFLDDATVLIANRNSELITLPVPSRGSTPTVVHRRAHVVVDAYDDVPVRTPGALFARGDGGLVEVFVSNNAGNDVTRYVLDPAGPGTVLDREVLISGDELDIPDGVSMSASGRWLAVSNHASHEVLIYAYDARAPRPATLTGILRGANYPHALEFVADDRALVLTDAGLPYVYTFVAPDGNWSGERSPAHVHRVMDDDTFNAGRYNPEEGGPKGMGALQRQRAIVLTSCYQRLRCLSFAAIGIDELPMSSPSGLEPLMPQASRPSVDIGRRAVARVGDLQSTLSDEQARRREADQRLVELSATHDRLKAELTEIGSRHEMRISELHALILDLEHARDAAESRSAALENSTTWRLTEPLRAIVDWVRRR